MLLGAASCGSSQIANDEPLPNVLALDQSAPADEPSVDDEIVAASSGPDVELSVSAGGVLDDVVVVTIKIRSIDATKLKSPQVLVQVGDGVSLEGNDACTFDDGDRCLVSDKIEDDSLPTGSAELDLYFTIASDAADPSVTFTAESANNPVTLDADPSNNVVTVVFVRSNTTPVIVSAPLPNIVELPTEAELPEHTLEVHTDGCGVFRTGEIGDDLTWVVSDGDGFQVLGRNAAGETQYRYYRPGTYNVVLETWGGDYYVAVSNEVTITC